jgi:Flp pilus assembly protein TadG
MSRPVVSSLFNRLRRNRSASAAVLTAAAIVPVVGMGAFAIDLGNVISAKRQLQTSTDAAALAGARDIGSPTNDPVQTAISYSAVTGKQNARANLTATMASGYPALKCFTSTGVTCLSGKSGVASANGIQVRQQASVPMYFARIFGLNTVNISATATAGAKGGQASPVDIMFVLDTTASMASTADNSCKGYDATTPANPAKIDCALAGVRAMLKGFWPSVDRAGLMVFPGVTSATVSKDYTCPTSNPTTVAYKSSPVYQILGLQTNYKTSDTASTLNTSANIVKAVGGVSGCSGIRAPGGQGTFYADAIAAAQAALTDTTKQRAIVLLSDGDASASSSDMPSGKYKNQCHEAITAAQTAKAAGFWVYSVAYGAASSGCSTDSAANGTSTIKPCVAMQQIASDSSKFFADTSSQGCPSGVNSTSGLVNLFQNIGTSLTAGRMLPDNTN